MIYKRKHFKTEEKGSKFSSICWAALWHFSILWHCHSGLPILPCLNANFPILQIPYRGHGHVLGNLGGEGGRGGGQRVKRPWFSAQPPVVHAVPWRSWRGQERTSWWTKIKKDTRDRWVNKADKEIARSSDYLRTSNISKTMSFDLQCLISLASQWLSQGGWSQVHTAL